VDHEHCLAVTAAKADTLSILTFEIGLFLWMGLTYFVFFPHAHLKPTDAGSWFMMQIGMVLGYFTSYPGNRWLVKKEWKEAMGQMGRTLREHEDGTADRLIEQLLGQRAAFLRFLSSKVGFTAAEDILQTSYLKLVEKGPYLEKDESVVSWFNTVLRHAIVDYYRRNSARDRAHEQFAAETPVSYEVELKDNACLCVSGVLGTLKPEYRNVLLAVDLNGRSVAEYAASERTTPNNAGVRLHRARKAAAKRLTQVCGACAEHKCLDCTCRQQRV